MKGRAWYFGPIEMNVTLLAPSFEKEGKVLIDYVAGIQDTLDGSSGREFTYLPIVFEDDCQAKVGHAKFVKTKKIHYKIKIKFMRE